MESLLPTLALLACPVGMGVMMWVMSRGSPRAAVPPPPTAGESLDDLRAEQHRLAAEIERLDGSRNEPTNHRAGARS